MQRHRNVFCPVHLQFCQIYYNDVTGPTKCVLHVVWAQTLDTTAILSIWLAWFLAPGLIHWKFELCCLAKVCYSCCRSSWKRQNTAYSAMSIKPDCNPDLSTKYLTLPDYMCHCTGLLKFVPFTSQACSHITLLITHLGPCPCHLYLVLT